MPSALRLLAATLVLGIVPPLTAQEPDHHLVRVTVGDTRHLLRLLALDPDLAACSHGVGRFPRTLEVIATNGDLRALRGAGFPIEVVQRGLEDHRARELARHGPFPEASTPPLGMGAMGGHWTLAQMEALLDELHRDHPGLCSARTAIGRSIEGRPLWMVKISDNVGTDENEPEVLYDALHHAREPLSMETTVSFMQDLLAGYGSDPSATFVIDERELFFVPCVNPDGYEYNRRTRPGGGGLWRKNRRDNGDGTFGVDLNRNYPTGWTAPNGGSSTTTSSNIYRGTAPLSEPEVAAMDAFAAGRSFVEVVTVHTYTDVLLHPYAYQPATPTNLATYDTLADRLTLANGVAHGDTWSTLYPLSGGAVDHHHAAHGSITWLPELGRSDEGGFWPDPQKTVEIAARHRPMLRAVALVAGAYLELGDVRWTEGPGGNGNGLIEPGETAELYPTVHDHGLQAPAGGAAVSMQVLTAGPLAGTTAVTVPVPALGAATATTPLTLTLPPGFDHELVRVELTVTGDGAARTSQRVHLLDPPVPVVDHDMEVGRGFRRDHEDTAVTGLWERGAPWQTVNGGQTIQPGTQTTAGGSACWVTDPLAGAGAGANDVDDGRTDLLSPVLDLSGLEWAEIRGMRWYTDTGGDEPFQIDLSLDGGGTWKPVLLDATSTGSWVPWSVEVPTPTGRVRLRFRARDPDQAPSLVEAAIDDLAVLGHGPPATLAMIGNGEPGGHVRLGVIGEPGARVRLFASDDGSATRTFPGVSGVLHLGLPGLIELGSRTLDATGHAHLDLVVPADPGLRGRSFHLQGAHLTATAVTLGNSVRLDVR